MMIRPFTAASGGVLTGSTSVTFTPAATLAGAGADPYEWYPDLDLADIPWHVGSGAWGAQIPLDTPAEPVITQTVSGISNITEFNTAKASGSGTRFVFDTSFDDPMTVDNLSDCEFVIPSGVNLGGLLLGGNDASIARWRIRGSTVGQHSGGRLGAINSLNSPLNDFIIDGIDLNGGSGSGASTPAYCITSGNGPPGDVQNERWAIVNCRMHAPGAAFIGSCSHIVFAGNSIYHGARTRAQNGFVEGWGVRLFGGAIVIYNNRIEGTRYHNIRLMPYIVGDEVCWINSNKLVNVYEAQTGWIWAHLGNPSLIPVGTWFENNDVYTQHQAACGHGTSLQNVPGDTGLPYGRVINNRFYGSGTGGTYSDSYFASVESAQGGGDNDWRTGNTYSALQDPGSWPAPGSPLGIALPGGATPTYGEDSCTFPGY